uniref:DUF433 domain-containing protein n=1 Tax=Cyanothece sp. (strain PCC 7425 / ATCC 29141) TaxID=395961 RepID=B8HN46_CYAP4
MAESLIRVEASPTFHRNLRTLAKKYRSIRDDVHPIIEQLEQGELPGDLIPDIGYKVFKLRIKNSNVQKGKSGGYRHLTLITINQEVMGGKPCIRGMRVTVGMILGLIASGYTTEEILQAYPYLELEDLRELLAYAAWRVEEIEVPLSVS